MGEKDCIFQRVNGLRYGYTTPFKVFDAAKNSKNFVQKLQLQKKIPAHNGCVNSICWNENGEFLLSGSDDQHLCISHGYNHSVLAYFPTGHRANIFSAKFLPNNASRKVVSCSGDGVIIYSDLENRETSVNNKFNCHFGTAYEIMTVPNDPNTFLSCGEDGTVRWFDLRAKTSCLKSDCKEDILLNCRCAVTSLAVNPLTPYQLAVGCADATVRIYDRRMLNSCSTDAYSSSAIKAMMVNFTVSEFTYSHRITSLSYSPNGQEMLVSYSSDYIYLFDVKNDVNERRLLMSSSSDLSPSNRCKSFSKRPLMKRLRVRGDWSDTGPYARPESDQQPRSLHSSLMQRMSDVLTSMFNSRNRSRTNRSRSSSSSEDSEMEAIESGNQEENNPSHPEDEITENRVGSQSEAQNSENQSQNSFNTSSHLTEEHNTEETGDNSSSVVNINDNKPNCDETHSFKESVPAASCSSSSAVSCNDPTTSKPVESDLQLSNDSPNFESPGAEVLNLSLQNLEQEISSRRDSLIEVHQVEPIVELHYSGQGLNSGLITVGVSGTCRSHRRKSNQSSQETSEPVSDARTCNQAEVPVSSSENVNSCDTEQSVIQPSASETEASHSNDATVLITPSHDLNDGNSNIDRNSNIDSSQHSSDNNEALQTSNPSSGVTETEQQVENVAQENDNTNDTVDREVESIQPSSVNPVYASVMPRVLYADLHPMHDSEQAAEEMENEGHSQEGDVALMMQVDSWDSDDEPPRSQSLASSWRRRSSESVPVDVDSVPESIMRTIDDELQIRSEEIENEEILMRDIPQPKIKKKYTGHRNARTMIKEATFWGDNFIMSGSDCGHIFVWDRYTAELVMLMEADHHVVNCLQPHPFDPILASSGIDYDIKIWAPVRDEPLFDAEKAAEIVKRNEVMLEETKDTITVPASFMIRMLASLNQLRSGSGSIWRRAAQQMRVRNLDRSSNTR